MTVAEAVQILGLRRPVDPDALKRAYRERAREHHPDRGGDPGTFQQVQAAYELLRRDDTATRQGARRPPPATASVDDRWWEAPARWHETDVDVSTVDWATAVPEEGSFVLTRDRLAVLLDRGAPPVAPVTAHSRSPGSWLHRVIGWLQPDLLAELRVAPAEAVGIAGHDVHVRFAFRSLKARRIVAGARLPQGWTEQRGSSSTTVQRVLHPSPDPRATATRVAELVDEVTSAMGWPLSDWYVVRTGSAQASDR